MTVESNMNFGQAIAVMKRGMRVARAGWNGKRMWLALVYVGDVTQVPLPAPDPGRGALPYVVGLLPNGVRQLPWIGMKTADDGFVPWLASQTDMLAEDWCVVD